MGAVGVAMNAGFSPVMRTASGLRYNPFRPNPAAVQIEDIAAGLARVSRYGGNQPGESNYNNASHSLCVLSAGFAKGEGGLDPLIELDLLLHDAPEVYLGLDIASPLKRYVRIGGRAVGDLEFDWMRAIFEGLGLPPEALDNPVLRDAVAQADELTRQIEEAVIWEVESKPKDDCAPLLAWVLTRVMRQRPWQQDRDEFLSNYYFLKEAQRAELREI